MLKHQNFKSFADHILAAADHWLGTDDLGNHHFFLASRYILHIAGKTEGNWEPIVKTLRPH